MKKVKHIRPYLRSGRVVSGHNKVVTTKALLDNVSEKSKLPKKDVSTMYNIMAENLQSEFKKGRKVSLKGIGIFKVKTRPARKARMGFNPLTKERMKFKAKPARKIIRFRPSKEIKI